jgi:hypothetical protein
MCEHLRRVVLDEAPEGFTVRVRARCRDCGERLSYCRPELMLAGRWSQFDEGWLERNRSTASVREDSRSY